MTVHPMFLLLSILGARIKKPTGEVAHVLPFTGDFLTGVLKKAQRAVVFFGESIDSIEFANYGIHRFKNDIIFIRSGKEDGAKHNCTAFPCILPFERGEVIRSVGPAPLRAAEFLRWLKRVVDPEIVRLTVPEELREVLGSQKPVVIAVDETKRPKQMPKTETLYWTTPETFATFGVNVEKGVYVFRPADRELVEFGKETWETLTDAGIMGEHEINTSRSGFLAGFDINKNEDDYGRKEIELLKALQSKFGENVQFTALYGNIAEAYEKVGQLETLEKPFFFVFNMSDLEGGRWLIYHDMDKMHDLDVLSKFVGNIVAGKEEFSTITEPVVAADTQALYKKLVSTNIEDFVLDRKGDVLVAFTTLKAGPCKIMQAVLNETASLLKDVQTLDIAWINCDANDLPDLVPGIDSYPSVWLFPAGKKDAPVQYKGARKVDRVMEFLTANAGVTFEVPEYDLEAAEARIHEVLHPKRVEESAE